ncbi:hypothetical protein AVEN_273425-1 [Araneus ventricosus]|uniref:Uncharacterized protein n=1 Tax=Araneus ventricosus TaxID=182803 RepID=A0A4Y2E2H3_ARAVE|nr:hypothetical protein AVEN_273425-1 [Araneus ventricosus]
MPLLHDNFSKAPEGYFQNCSTMFLTSAFVSQMSRLVGHHQNSPRSSHSAPSGWLQERKHCVSGSEEMEVSIVPPATLKMRRKRLR